MVAQMSCSQCVTRWVRTGSMIVLWSLLLTVAASAQKVVDSNEDIGPEAFTNVTTLYPVANITSDKSTTNHNRDNINETKPEKEKVKTEATSWKIDAAFAEALDKDDNKTVHREETKSEWKNETKEFRPSQHLGSLDDVTPTKESAEFFTRVVKKPASGFVSSKEEYRSTINKIPKEFYNTHKQYPYKFESTIYTRAKDSWNLDRPKAWPHGTPGLGDRPNEWSHTTINSDSFGAQPGKTWSQDAFDGFGEHPHHNWGSGLDGLEPKPTVEAPVKLPAGGLYKYTDPFQDKPGNHDDDFGLDIHGHNKENAIKKRGDPWQGVLRMLTAFIPVGIIISALTPSIITVENTAPDHTYPSPMYRRADQELSALPAISERCRRRLLCELHSDYNYSKDQSTPYPRQGRQCHRIRCADTEALAKTLRWLLDRQTNRHYT